MLSLCRAYLFLFGLWAWGFKDKGTLSSLLTPEFTLLLTSCFCDLILLLRLLPLLFPSSFLPARVPSWSKGIF